ncbi:MAG: AbrB family transcriptional regulator [Pseudomonadota bacterium]
MAPLLVTLALALAGAGLAHGAGLPLPWLSGPLLVTAGAAIGGLRVLGAAPTFPVNLRFVLVPVIGVAIGGQVGAVGWEQAATWLVTLSALALYLPVAMAMSYAIYRRAGGYPRVTAFYAAMPGGLIEAVAMGEKAGADVPTLTLLQFARLILCILMVPLAIAAYEGRAVGSAAGLALGTDPAALTLSDVAVLVGAALVGYLGGRRIGLPAALITGPLIVSAAVHLAGMTDADPPGFVVALTQYVVGTALGVRFVDMARGEALRGLGWAALSVGAALLLALGLALLLAPVIGPGAGADVEAVVLAFAPGGVTEMSLVALSLEIGVVFVSAHHVARILITVSMVGPIHAWLRRHRGW